jgi:hypothetical protein
MKMVIFRFFPLQHLPVSERNIKTLAAKLLKENRKF